MGKVNALKNSHPSKNIFSHGPVEKSLSALSFGLKVNIKKNIAGTNTAPRIVSQKDDVRFIFKTSACVDIIKLVSYC